jgi:hypothetical protein
MESRSGGTGSGGTEEIAQSITEEDTYNAFSEVKNLTLLQNCDFVKLNMNDLQQFISDMKNVSSCDPINVHIVVVPEKWFNVILVRYNKLFNKSHRPQYK